jgi:hypothetical protein
VLTISDAMPKSKKFPFYFVLAFLLFTACNNPQKKIQYPIHSLPVANKKNHLHTQLKAPNVAIVSDTLRVNGPMVVFFEPGQKEFDLMDRDQGEDSGLDEIVSDFVEYSTKVVDSLIKTSKLKAIITHKKIILVELDNGEKISFDRTKGDNIVGTILTNGRKKPKIDFEVGTTEDYFADIENYFGKL